MNLHDLKHILSLNRVEFRETNKADELSLCCPKCSDSKFKLQVNPYVTAHKIQGWCFCYKGWHSFPLQELFRVNHIDIKLDESRSKLSGFEEFQAKMRDIKQEEPKTSRSKTTPTLPPEALPIIPATSWMAKKCLAYLQGRGFTESQIEDYGMMYASSGEYLNRVIIPTFEFGELQYFQARDITGHSKLKVLNPIQADNALGKSEVLFNFDQARCHSQVTVCEGWGSAMASGYNAVAINGKVASKTQVAKLREHWNDFLVLLDHGAEGEACDLAIQLMKPGGKVSIILLPDGDPNDYSYDELESFKAKAIPLKSPAEAKMLSLKLRCL
jgi:DNA primase